MAKSYDETKRGVIQKIIQAEAERQRRSKFIVESVAKNLGKDPGYLGMEMERAIAEIEKEEVRIRAEAAKADEQKALEYLSRYISIANPPTPKFPLQIKLTSRTSEFLNAQLFSSAPAVPIRAEILEEPKDNIVSVCVIFKRNGSTFVDVFRVSIDDLYSRGSLSEREYAQLQKMSGLGLKSSLDQINETTMKYINKELVEAMNAGFNTAWEGWKVAYGQAKQEANPTPEPEVKKKPFRLIEV